LAHEEIFRGCLKRQKTPTEKKEQSFCIPQPPLPILGERELKLPSIPLSQYWERGIEG
jgi:hypothetical protein